MSRYHPNKNFTDCEVRQGARNEGFRRYADCKSQCIDSYTSCASKIPTSCTNCKAYCDQACNPTQLLGSGYCANVCMQQPPSRRSSQCLLDCQANVRRNVPGCQAICNSKCTADCPSYLKSRCITEACTLPVCRNQCTQGVQDYYLAPSLFQSLLNKSTYYCKAGGNVNTGCLGVDASTNTWIYKV